MSSAQGSSRISLVAGSALEVAKSSTARTMSGSCLETGAGASVSVRAAEAPFPDPVPLAGRTCGAHAQTLDQSVKGTVGGGHGAVSDFLRADPGDCAPKQESGSPSSTRGRPRVVRPSPQRRRAASAQVKSGRK